MVAVLEIVNKNLQFLQIIQKTQSNEGNELEEWNDIYEDDMEKKLQKVIKESIAQVIRKWQKL